MNKTPAGSGACCLPRAEGITYLKIGAGNAVIGVVGLENVFQQLYALGRLPEETTDAELVDMTRKFNYIPRRAAIEADYAIALREAYAQFYTRQAGSEHSP